MLHRAVLTFSLLLCENPACLVEHSTSLSLSWRRPCTLGGDTPVWLSSPTPATAALWLLLRPTSMCRYLERSPRRPPHSHFPHFLQASARCSLTSEALLGHGANSLAGPSPLLLGFILLCVLFNTTNIMCFSC